MNLAIDRDELARSVFAGFTKPTRVGPFSPDYWATEGVDTSWPYDPAAASALLKAATSQPIELVCITFDQHPQIGEVAALLEAQLQRVRVRLRLVPLPLRALAGRLRSGDFDVFVMSMASGFGSAWPYRLWHSQGDHLKSGYTSADRALDALSTAQSPEAERAAVHAVLDIMHRDPPAAFLMPVPSIRAVRRTWRVPDKIASFASLPHWKLAEPPCPAP